MQSKAVVLTPINIGEEREEGEEVGPRWNREPNSSVSSVWMFIYSFWEASKHYFTSICRVFYDILEK